MKKITVLLPEAEVERHIIDICSDSIKFDVGMGLAPFDKLNVLPGPPRKTIYLKKQEDSDAIGYVHILPVRNNSIVKFVAESPIADFDEFARLVTGYFQDLNLLAETPAEPAEVRPAQPVKTTGEYSIGFFLEFEKGKTPKNLFVLIACTAYIEHPNDIGAIGLMRRVYIAVRSTWDNLNAIKRINPNTPGIAYTIQMFNESFPSLTAEDMTEGEILREIALKILNDFKDTLTEPEQSKHFFNNSELIPVTTRAIIEQIRALSVDEAGELLALMPLIEKWKKDLNPSQPGQAETAQADLTAKATPQSQIIFQFNDYVAGNKEDHSIHVGNISNSAGIAIGESARVNIDQSAGQSEKPREPKTIPQPETNSGQSPYENEVFVSYAWENESERTVNELQQAFDKRGIPILRDKKDIDYKGSIEEFEQRIGRGQCIVLVISDKYLRSEHCMYELMEADKHKNLRERIFPIVLADAQIYKAIDRLNYIKHWDEQIEKLNQAIKKVNVMTNLGSITADLDKYARIRASFDHLTDLLSDMNALTPEIHATSGFSTLIDAVVRAMAKK